MCIIYLILKYKSSHRFIVVISEDDYICQACVNLFNRLDNLETELQNAKNCIIRILQHTYSRKPKKTLSIQTFKSLQLMLINKNKNFEPLKKKRDISRQGFLKESKQANCMFLQKNNSKVKLRTSILDNDIFYSYQNTVNNTNCHMKNVNQGTVQLTVYLKTLILFIAINFIFFFILENLKNL